MLKVIVIDDEPFIRKLIIQNLTDWKELIVVGDCGSVSEGKILINSCKPDVVFLDIQLSDGNGFELLKQLENFNFKLLFITSYEQYAIKAIKSGAFDYILKPLDTEELDEAIKRLISATDIQEKVKERLQVAQNNLAGLRDHITLRFNESLRIIKIADIMYCQSDSGYTSFYLEKSEKIVVSKGLKEYEKLLPEDKFLRIHKSYLVNTTFIKEYIKEGYIRLSNDISLPVAVRRKEDILKYFQ